MIAVQHIHELLELSKHISTRPTLYALTPEMALGQIQGLAWAILLSFESETLESSSLDVHHMLKETMRHIPETNVTSALLCDESLTPRTSSFDALRENSRRFLLLLEQRVEELSAG